MDKEVAQGELLAIPLAPRLLLPLCLVMAKDKFSSRLLSLFADFARGRLQQYGV